MLQLDHRIGSQPCYVLTREPVNLMVVPDELRKCVVFVALEKKGGERRMIGTAFLVGRALGDTGQNSIYAVTAQHVLKKIEADSAYKVLLRVNLVQGGFTWVETRLNDWVSHPDDALVDVSVFRFTEIEKFELKFWPLSGSATNEVIVREGIGIGDEVFLVGLFSQHYGSEKNIPIVRVGNIAAMPEEKVMTTDWGAMDAYLIEARSIGGISGSPVFAYLGAQRRSGSIVIGGPSFYLLGLMHGHWDKPDSVTDIVINNKVQDVNMGIAIVVPVTKLLEVIYQPSMEKCDIEIEGGVWR